MNPEPRSSAAGHQAGGGAVLDEKALARLRELDPDGRHGVLPRVLAAFETSLARLLAQLITLREGGDANAVVAVAHTLKSSSASVGALLLSAACAEVERRLRKGSVDTLAACGPAIDSLIAEGEAVLVTVRAMLRP